MADGLRMKTNWFIYSRRRGFTLIELMVALALSALVLRLILPMLIAASHTRIVTVPARVSELAAWRSVLRADLSELVAQSKCGTAVVQIHPASATNAFDRLELQTLSRPGESSRGPLAATYVLELMGKQGFSLVRYGRGWHDGARTRHILLSQLSSWQIQAATAATRPTTLPSGDFSSALRIRIERDGRASTILFSTPPGAAVEVTP